jgi:hypothetical protein
MTFMGGDHVFLSIQAEATTSGYRVTGTIRTRFDRIAAILNSMEHTHLVFENATVRELDERAVPWGAENATVPIDEILFFAAGLPEVSSMDAIVIPKRPFPATVGLPPFQLSGMMYVPDSIETPATVFTINPDKFIVMTDAAVVCPPNPALDASYPVIAFQRQRVHVFSVGNELPTSDDEDAGDAGVAQPGVDPRHELDWG